MYPYIYMHKPIPLTHNYDSINTLQGLCRFLTVLFLAKKEKWCNRTLYRNSVHPTRQIYACLHRNLNMVSDILESVQESWGEAFQLHVGHKISMQNRSLVGWFLIWLPFSFSLLLLIKIQTEWQICWETPSNIDKQSGENHDELLGIILPTKTLWKEVLRANIYRSSVLVVDGAVCFS